jgi:hypothetical protein
MRIKLCSGGVLIPFFFISMLQCQTVNPDTMPEVVLRGLDRLIEFEVSDRINPYYLRGDFNGDGKADYAVLVTSKKEHKRGFVVFLSGHKNPVIVGAGKSTTYGAGESDDLNFDIWRVAEEKTVEQVVTKEVPPKLKGEAILAGKSESASGLFYWNGLKFRWYQQGD